MEKAGYPGDLCLLVQDLAPETLAFLRARRSNLVSFQKSFLQPKWTQLVNLCKPFLKPRQRQLLDEKLALTYLHPNCARLILFRSYLAECGRHYDQVMLADIRDILFQKDPFAFPFPRRLERFPGRREPDARFQFLQPQLDS